MSKNQEANFDPEFTRFIHDVSKDENQALLHGFYKEIYKKGFGVRGKGHNHPTLESLLNKAGYKVQKSTLKDLHRLRRDIDLTWECGGKY